MSSVSSQPLTVSELTRQVRDLLEANFDQVTCLGEVSNLMRARSGHVYFTLKDDDAQISAVIWKGTASRLNFELQDGLEIVATGPIEVYPPRGSYQLIVKHAIPQGIGPLELAFRQLQEKLAAEGLFAPERKRPLPAFPRKIAMVTSPTGAAIRDMLQVLTRRWPLADVIVIPVPVQGQGAGIRIAEGLDIATRIPGVDVIVTGRGGGSLEDLWCFNEEVVARAIVRTTVPVISAVGHEIDVSISDLVADFRALTPTEAIEHAVPDVADVQAELERIRQRALRALKQQAQQARYRLSALADRRPFSRPRELFSSLRQRLDEWDFRLGQLSRKLIEERRQELSKVSAQLDALSPLKTLQRGYGLIQDVETGQTIRSVSRLQPGQQIRTVLSDGTAHATVSSIEQSRNDSIK